MTVSTNSIRYSNMDDVSVIELLEVANITGIPIENLEENEVVIFEDIDALKLWIYSDADYTELRQLINSGLESNKPMIDLIKGVYDIGALENGFYFKYYG